jgi:hypothetical protein
MNEKINSNLSRWHFLWTTPLAALIVIISSGLFLSTIILYILLNSMLVALPVWLIWGSIFSALMGYWEWVGIIVVIRLIFFPIFTNNISNYLTNKYKTK